MVTRIPKMIGTTTAETDKPRPPPSKDIPRADSTARITATKPMPEITPSTEPRKPTTRASTTTDPVIWRWEAPIERSSANSLMRWATIIEKVLAIINVPTSRPISPKATKK